MYERCNEWVCQTFGNSQFDMEEYCWANDYWSWVDDVPTITMEDFKNACDDLANGMFESLFQ